MNSSAFTNRGPKWVTRLGHRSWLTEQANDLFSFFEKGVIDPRGGFFSLDVQGKPLTGNTSGCQLHATTRMVHCFAVAYLLGRPGSDAIIDHGMRFLWKNHRDTTNGGYFWNAGHDRPYDDTKQAYGHAFVLLAASSAKVAGHPDADRLLEDVSTVIQERFWERQYGACAEQFGRDWKAYDQYRGQNSNMHLVEALMAACEATGDKTYLSMAVRIAELIIRHHTEQNNWRVPEHFTSNWLMDREYSGDPVFRPHGTIPGHSLEWTRLLVQLWEAGDRRMEWLATDAKAIFRQATDDAWDREKGGFYYTLGENGRPEIRNRYWWPCCEGIGAAAFLNSFNGDASYEEWYRKIWSFCAVHFVDKDHGGWYPQLDENLNPSSDPFFGKPDIYHALQSCLIPLLPTTGSITQGAAALGCE